MSADLSFPTVRAAMDYYFERRLVLQSANGQAPRGELAPDGSMVRVDVQGGRGGMLDEVHVTLIGIARAMAALEQEQPRAHEALVLNWRDGISMDEISKRAKCSHATVSAYIGRGESFLWGWLRRDGTVRHAA